MVMINGFAQVGVLSRVETPSDKCCFTEQPHVVQYLHKQPDDGIENTLTKLVDDIKLDV